MARVTFSAAVRAAASARMRALHQNPEFAKRRDERGAAHWRAYHAARRPFVEARRSLLTQYWLQGRPKEAIAKATGYALFSVEPIACMTGLRRRFRGFPGGRKPA